MKNLVLFGGSGGLGVQLSKLLMDKYNLISLSSNDLDIRDFDSVKKFFEDKKIDIVINASGINFDTFIHKIDKIKLEKIQNMIDVNIIGNYNILSNCLPYMREQGYGRIILFSSILSDNPVVGTSIYSGCKGFIDNLVKSTSLENLSKGVTCNSIKLGYFDGGMCHKMPEDFKNYLLFEKIGLKRWGNIDELYRTIDYIINTEYFTGQSIRIDGGIKI